jgi:hypothetical protein
VGRTPSEGFSGRAVALDVFRRFGCRVWVNTPGKPFVPRPKFAPCARPGRFLGFERPIRSGVFRVLLDSGQITQSQSLVCADTPQPPLPAPPLPAPSPVTPPPGMRARQQTLDDDDSDDEVDLRPAASPPVPPLAPGLSVQQTSGSDDGSADEVILHPVAMQAPAGQALPRVQGPVEQAPAAGPAPIDTHAVPVGRPVRVSRNTSPKYAFGAWRPQAQGSSLRTMVGHVEGIRGVPDLASRRPTKCSKELMSGGWPRGGAGRKSESSGTNHKSGAARVQARGRWRRVANNVARSKTARRGSSQAQITGAKRDRWHNCRQGERPLSKLTLKPAVTWREAVAADLGRLKAATAGAAPQSHALPPRTVKEALARPDASEWVRAKEEEVQSCLKYDVWKEFKLPAGKQALPSRFVFERKRDGRYKARLVTGGHRQQHGLDFAETIAPVCSYRTMRVLLAVSAHEILVLRHFDVQLSLFECGA